MLELVLTPIPGDSPTGRPARDEAEFEQIKAEIDKISGVNAASVDWARVLELCSGLLERKSKDLLVLSYGILAAFETGGFATLPEGLEATHKLISLWWEPLFPERARGRVAAFEWLAQRGAASVSRSEPRGDDRAAVEASIMQLETLDTLLREKLGPIAPGLGELKGALREKLQSLEQPAVPESPSTSGSALAASPASYEFSSEEGRSEALREATTGLRALASAMRRSNPRDARAYKLMRLGTWGRLEQLPPDEDRVTRIPPVDISADFLAHLGDLGSRGEWAQVIEQAESRFAGCIFWFDLQYHVAKGMDGMGASFNRAREAVLHDCRGLLQGFPGLADLKYADETPFASDETRRWIAEELAGGSGGGGGPAAYSPGGPAADATGEVRERIAEAKELAQGGKAPAAIQLLAAAAQAAGLRDKILLRIEIAGLLAAAKEPRLAVAQMELLDEELLKSPFEQWDPATGVLFLQHFLRHQRVLARGEGELSPSARKAHELYARLSRLDAVAALAMRP